MGDRANIRIIDRSGESVFFYSHWTGTELPEVVRTALSRNLRWMDAPYLARIIFDAMTDGAHGEETGFGISATVGDGDDRIVEVDVPNQLVRMVYRGRDIPSSSFGDWVRYGPHSWPED